MNKIPPSASSLPIIPHPPTSSHILPLIPLLHYPHNCYQDLVLIKELCSSIGSQITPFASRTFQYTKEQLGQADDKVRVRGSA